MANRAGLKKVTKTVRGKHGSVRRSYWVRGTEAVKGAAKKVRAFVGRHKGKIAAGAALAGAAALAYKGHRAYSGLSGEHKQALKDNLRNMVASGNRINSLKAVGVGAGRAVAGGARRAGAAVAGGARRAGAAVAGAASGARNFAQGLAKDARRSRDLYKRGSSAGWGRAASAKLAVSDFRARRGMRSVVRQLKG